MGVEVINCPHCAREIVVRVATDEDAKNNGKPVVSVDKEGSEKRFNATKNSSRRLPLNQDMF